MSNTKKFLAVTIICLLSLSCNDLKYDTASKRGIEVTELSNGRTTPILSFNPTPELMGAFLWPSVQYFERGKKQGWINSPDYVSYIAKISRTVIVADDEFNKWTLRYLQLAKESAKELEEIGERQDVNRSKIRTLNQENKKLRKKRQNLTNAIENAAEEDKATYEEQLAVVEQRMAEVFREKKEFQRILTSLNEREEALRKPLKEAISHQLNVSMVVQQALDPHAVSFVLDEEGNKMVYQYGFPLRDINEEKQINWIKVFEDNIGTENYFDIRDKKIVIRLGHWDGQSYETVYQKDGRGEWRLHPDSTIYDVSFSSDEVLQFKFREKDHKGNETGRVFEFELQLSEFAGRFRFIGDIKVLQGEEIVRRGQLKVSFSRG